MSISRRSAMLGASAAAVVAGVPGAAIEANEPLVALGADLMEARAAGYNVGALYCAAHDKAGDWAFG